METTLAILCYILLVATGFLAGKAIASYNNNLTERRQHAVTLVLVNVLVAVLALAITTLHFKIN